MKLEKELIQQWLELRTPRESGLIFLTGFAFVYLLWNLFFELPLHSKTESLEKQNLELVKMLDTQKQNLNSIEQIISSSSFTRNLQKQQQLSSKSRTIGKQLENLEQSFVPVELLAQITNDIIAQQEEVALIGMKTFSEEPWLKTKNTKDTSFYNMQNVYKHKIEVEFRGTYFNTIAFLGHLEKLPWHLYWDHLAYQVLTYPEARVVARFYVLSNQKG